MNLRLLLVPLSLGGALVGCESKPEIITQGVINLDLLAQGAREGSLATISSEEVLPDLGSFAIQVFNEQETFFYWESYDKVPNQVYLPVGLYCAQAFMGDSLAEGFDVAAYDGKTIFEVYDNQLTSVAITAALTQVKTSVSYSDTFKRYFSDAKPRISSGEDHPVIFSYDETRSAYFRPGSLAVDIDVTSPMGVTSRLEVARIDQTRARDFYQFHLDVDAGESMIHFSYDSTTIEVPIDVLIDDEEFTQIPPLLKSLGFDASVPLVHTEQDNLDQETAINLIAKAGFKQVLLTTTSPDLLAKGFPASVDLMQLSPEQRQSMAAFGVIPRGFEPGQTKVTQGYIDLNPLLPNLSPLATGVHHEFQIEAVDQNNLVAQTLIFFIETEANALQIMQPQPITLGEGQVELEVNLHGEQSLLTFEYLDAGEWKPCSQMTYVSSEVDRHRYRFTLPQKNIMYNLRALYKSKVSDAVVAPINYPEIRLLSDPLDVWAKRVYLGIETAQDSLIAPYLQLYVSKAGEDHWVKTPFSYENHLALITGLDSESDYQFKATFNPEADVDNFSEMLALRTDHTQPLPNAGFEHWYANKTDRNGVEITKNLSFLFWNKYFVQAKDDATSHGWSTVNEKTTQDGKTPVVTSNFLGTYAKAPYVGCSYVATSGTVPTEDKVSGAKAALIRSVGWGTNNKADRSNPHQADAGQLYLGTFNQTTREPNYGIAFTARPSGVRFHYKYLPKNPEDRFIAQMVVLDAQGGIIAQQTLPANDSGAQATYKQVDLRLDYSDHPRTPVAQMYIRFVSGTKLEKKSTDFTYPKFGNLNTGEFVGAQLYVDDLSLIYE